MSYIDRESNQYFAQESESDKTVVSRIPIELLFEADGHRSTLYSMIYGMDADEQCPKDISVLRENDPDQYHAILSGFISALEQARTANSFLDLYLDKVTQTHNSSHSATIQIDSPHATFHGKDSISKKSGYSHSGDMQNGESIYFPNSED